MSFRIHKSYGKTFDRMTYRKLKRNEEEAKSDDDYENSGEEEDENNIESEFIFNPDTGEIEEIKKAPKKNKKAAKENKKIEEKKTPKVILGNAIKKNSEMSFF